MASIFKKLPGSSAFLLTWAALLLCSVATASIQDTTETPKPTANPCPPCDDVWCLVQGCPSSRKYLCTAGPAMDGCNYYPWHVSTFGSCESCCDTENCKAAPPPPVTSCPNCTEAQCQEQHCIAEDPYFCASGSSKGGCKATAWTNPVQCTACCDTKKCSSYPTAPPTPRPRTGPPAPATPTPPETPTPNCPACTAAQCAIFSCPKDDAYVCTHGVSKHGCSNIPWGTVPGCDACCDLIGCSALPPPPEKPCPPCTATQCVNRTCGRAAPNMCTNGTSKGGCSPHSWDDVPGCTECCDVVSCLPPPPPPRPPSPWDLVPPSNNCTLNGTPVYAPNPKATPWGGRDVSDVGCMSSVSEACCGFTPRFNWIISTCNEDPAKRESMACRHPGGNNSKVELYYINAYQWDGTSWHRDPTSSKQASQPGELVDLDEFWVGPYANESLKKQDWDRKYAPTTAQQGTDGLGPPAYMIVMSAKQFSWSAMYVLNQITLNRGPGAEHFADNCWASSSGEFDMIEPPFWAGVHLPQDRLYTTVTADSGRCLPVEKKVPSRYNKQCNDKNCCEACSCEPGYVCFGNTSNFGYEAMGCVLANHSASTSIPPHDTIFTIDGNNETCGEYYGGVSGGQDSEMFFTQRDEEGSGEVIYVALMDGDGIYVYRWGADNETKANSVWGGITKYSSEEVLFRSAPNTPIAPSPPCNKTDWEEPCAVFSPSCGDDCVILSAGGVFGLGQTAGAYAAESARDGLNWWNLFESTKQTPDPKVNELSKWVYVEHFTPPLPYHCNHSCGADRCHDPRRCPADFQYQCTKGDGNGGCSNITDFWPLSPHCSSCCDVQLCDIKCNACTQEQCYQQQCSGLDPFFCAEGPAACGCSNVSSTWTTNPTCYACCDASACRQYPPPPKTHEPTPTSVSPEHTKQPAQASNTNRAKRPQEQKSLLKDVMTGVASLAQLHPSHLVDVAVSKNGGGDGVATLSSNPATLCWALLALVAAVVLMVRRRMAAAH